MNDAEIAEVLSNLTRKSRTCWGLGSIENWVDEQGQRIGMSFYNAWITKIAPEKKNIASHAGRTSKIV